MKDTREHFSLRSAWLICWAALMPGAFQDGARAGSNTLTDVTAYTLSGQVYAETTVGLIVPVEADWFSLAQSSAEAAVPCNELWGLLQTNYAERITGIGTLYSSTNWSEAMSASKRRCEVHMSVDLTGYGTGQYDRAYLEWRPKKVIRRLDGDVVLHEAHSRVPLALGQNQDIPPRAFEPGRWTTWGEFLGGILSYNSWKVTEPTDPRVIVVTEGDETQTDPLLPGGETGGTGGGKGEGKEVGEPINVVNGNVATRETDLVLPCPGPSLTFRRFYNSTVNYDGPLGHRWTHVYDACLFETNTLFAGATNSWAVLRRGSGDSLWFRLAANGAYERPFHSNWRLVKSDGGYQVRAPAGVTWAFDTNGVLGSVSNLWGASLTFSYSNSFPNHRLSRAEHSSGMYMNFAYTQGRLSEVRTPSAGLRVLYFYNDRGELTNATREASGGSTRIAYRYDDGAGFWNHSLTQRVNAAGHVFSWEYERDDMGRVTSRGTRTVVDGEWYDTLVAHDPNGLSRAVVTYRQERGESVYEHQWDPLTDEMESIRGPLPDATNWFAEGAGQVFERDGSGNVTKAVAYDYGADEWSTEARQFDGFHNITNEAFGYCAAPTDAWAYAWNTNWLVLTAVVDPDGRTAQFDYMNGSLIRVRMYGDASNSFDTTYAYSSGGLRTAITNANGHWIGYSHDAHGRLSGIRPQAGPAVVFSNNVLGHVEKAVLPGPGCERVWDFDPDELGRLRGVVYPNGLQEAFGYDPVGNLTNHVDTAGRTTRYTYAPTRKLTSAMRELNLGQWVTNSVVYDRQFNTLVIKDAMSRTVEAYALDPQDRPGTVTNAEGQTMGIVYGLGDFIQSVSRFDGTTVSNGFDSGGRLCRVRYPDATNTYGYLGNGLLESAVNAAGMVSNAYNMANRLSTAKGVAPSGTVTYTYLPAGQVSNVTSVAGTSTYAYDDAERLAALTASRLPLPALGFHYTYNTNNGLVAGMTCTNTGVSVSYAYDVVDLLTGITWTDGQSNVLKSFSYQYSPAMVITNLALEDGSARQYTYDGLDRLTGETRLTAGGLVENAATYAYDEVGNRTQKAGDGWTVSYSYPYGTQGNRLAGWTATSTNGFAALARMDVAGHASEPIGTNEWLGQLWVSPATGAGQATNKVTPVVVGTNFAVSGLALGVGTQRIVAAIGDRAGNVGYATNTLFLSVITNAGYHYSAAGCLTNALYQGSGGDRRAMALAWNSQYQLVAVRTNGVLAESYTYDALGRRGTVSDGATTNWLVYDGIHVVAEVDTAGTLLTSYVWGPGIDHLLAFTTHSASGTNTYYPLTDHLGTVHALVDPSGSVVESYRFDAWGRVLAVCDAAGNPLASGSGSPASAVGNRILWQGREYSWKTGLYYFRARWYDPVTGRWFSNDPIGISGGLNQYVAFENNPVNVRDPNGLRPLTDWEKSQLALFIPMEDLNNADLHPGKLPWYMISDDYVGITRGNDICFAKGYYPEDECEKPTDDDLALLGHELVHVGQYRKGMNWLKYLWSCRSGYNKSKYEIEAYSVDRDIRRILDLDRRMDALERRILRDVTGGAK